MVRLTPIFRIAGIGLILISIAGCEELLTPPPLEDKLDEVSSSITITSGGEETGETMETEADSTIYDFNDLSSACISNNKFYDIYQDLSFVPIPRWAVCNAQSRSEGQDGLALLPADMSLYHTQNNGTTQLEDIRIVLPEPADSASLVTANYNRPKQDAQLLDFASWLVAYDADGNEIDRALNNAGNYTGVKLVVHAIPDTSIYSLGIETYPLSTYLDNLETWVPVVPPPDTTAPTFTYTVEQDTIDVNNRKMMLALSGVSAEDDRGGPVTLTVTVESNQNVTGPGNPTSPDWEFSDNGDGSVDVYVRAEYSGKKDDRIYTITLQGTDASDNLAEETLQVVVVRK